MADEKNLESERETVEPEERASVQEEIDGTLEERDAEQEAAKGAEELTEVERLEKELEEARSEADEYLDGWRRAQAEFSNYKKRQRAEQAKVRELANANLLRKLLPVLDDFDRAFVTMPAGIEKLSWTQGLLMVLRKLEAILETEGVESIETDDQFFDPYRHEAVTHEELPGFEEGEIIGEIQKGYVLGDRVLRPALVRVAKAPRPAPTEDADTDETGSTVQAEVEAEEEAVDSPVEEE